MPASSANIPALAPTCFIFVGDIEPDKLSVFMGLDAGLAPDQGMAEPGVDHRQVISFRRVVAVVLPVCVAEITAIPT